MTKELRIKLNEEQVTNLDKIKNKFTEKTYKKTIVRVLEEYVNFYRL